MQHASSRHANQESACPSCYRSPETVPRSKGQTLFTDYGPSSGRQAVRAQSLFPFFPPKNQDKAAPSVAYKYQGTRFMKKDEKGGDDSPKRRRTHPSKSRIPPLSPPVKQEYGNKKSTLSFSFFLL
ncbi:hypothetical protein AXF42_Ash018305 [Apostasia shenzhenica]|uniref:Uncharacterized protein n=1 Tax=Apostasia shenzhenica TaxID=1088818 RepID=A0A2I0B2Q5_9ASPA|nr:hypothetical protein AXF42_Ash018305 [Apostasia shenzhenica]